MSDQAKCELCGEPMPPGEDMFKMHGYSGNCPKPPTPAPPRMVEPLSIGSILDPCCVVTEVFEIVMGNGVPSGNYRVVVERRAPPEYKVVPGMGGPFPVCKLECVVPGPPPKVGRVATVTLRFQ